MKIVFAGCQNRMKAFFILSETYRANFLCLIVLIYILKLIILVGVGYVFIIQRIIVIVRLYEADAANMLLSLPIQSLLHFKASEGHQVVFPFYEAVQKMYEKEQRNHEVHHYCDSNYNRQAQFLAQKAVKRMYLKLCPKHKCQEKVRYFYGTYYDQKPFDDGLIFDDIYLWHFEYEIMLYRLSDIENGQIQKEGHPTVISNENEARDHTNRHYGHIEDEEAFMQQSFSFLPSFGEILFNYHNIIHKSIRKHISKQK